MPDPAYLAIERLLWLIERLGPAAAQPLVEPRGFPWLAELAAAAGVIEGEARALIQCAAPADCRELSALPVAVSGSWRLIPLADRRGRYPYAARLPATMGILARVPGLRAADLALLTAGSRIRPHRGNNWGVLRAHLTLTEPDGDAACALRFPRQGTAVPWRAGHAFIFDDSFEHEAVNARASGRLVLLVEVDRALPAPLAWLNAATQHCYRYHPVQRGVRDRVLARYAADLAGPEGAPDG